MKSFVRARSLRSVAALALFAALGVFSASLAGAVPVGATTGSGPATYTGLGFDNCGLPHVSQLSAWTKAKSPYQALNVYIGGVNAACPTPVSPTWVKGVTALGWGIIPTYVGLQAPNPECPCSAISTNLTKAAAEGVAAADDAGKIMATDGMPAGKNNPIYYDMEGYTQGGTTSKAVLTFLKSWTKEVHKLGYLSGVYANGPSGLTDLVKNYGTSYPEPDDIWIAWWNYQHNTKDPYVPAADWANHQRIHQFNGNITLSYGGVRFTGADADYCDGAVVSAATV
jgi:hypothetical protein